MIMPKSRTVTRANKKFGRKLERLENETSAKNICGFTDLTPYNALTGKDKISKATLTDCKQKVSGSFNG